MHKKHSNLHKIADAQGYAKRMQTVIPNTTFLSPGRKVEAVGLVESILRLSSNDSGSIGFAVSLKNKLSIIENEMIANRNAGKVQDEEVQGKRTSGALSGQAKHFMPMKETVRIVTFAGEAEISAARKAAQGLKAKVKSGECSGFGYEINDVLDSLRLGKQVT
ncbi:MAG: hypothetical protein NT051_03550, partial [Candidatus Micrarchaeota archaeon]|nr:hypothetical protein [Candidatus Micrarchaeota archaeon]